MKLYDECLPCLLRQVVEATRMSTQDRNEQQVILDTALKLLMRYKDYPNSPELCRDIHLVMKQISGCDDPYHSIKARDTLLAKQLSTSVEAFIENRKGSLTEINHEPDKEKIMNEILNPKPEHLPMEIADNAEFSER